ncbi:MAG TPA: DinB family protein [Terriglobales bacterium]|nr:DinB family protein [Terriglobales bacterium]
MSNRPTEKEYSGYYGKYVAYVPEEDVLGALEASGKYTQELLAAFTEQQAGRLRGTTHWTLKQTVGHLCDGERIFAYRAMRIARGDKTPLPGFEQDDYIATGNFNERTWQNLLAEYAAVRTSTIEMARGFTPEMMQQVGTASDSTVSARALLYVIVGHERRHVEALKQHAK